MTSNPKLMELLNHLHEATILNRLRWDAVNDGSFQVSTGQAVFNIREDSDSDDKGFEYFIKILNHSGRVIKTYLILVEDDTYGSARNLFEKAQDNAFQVGEVLDSMIAEIQQRNLAR